MVMETAFQPLNEQAAQGLCTPSSAIWSPASIAGKEIHFIWGHKPVVCTDSARLR